VQLPSVRKFSYAQKLVEFGIMSRLQSFHFHVPQRKKKKVSITTNVKIALLLPWTYIWF